MTWLHSANQPTPGGADRLQALICSDSFSDFIGSDINISPGGMVGKRAGLTNAHVS